MADGAAVKRVPLAAGGGGQATGRLLREVFAPLAAARPPLRDAALLGRTNARIAFTTDAFVVSPFIFPGGDIGKLAVCGTVNDLAVVGAHPRSLSAAFVIEEGLALTDLERVVASMQAAAEEAGVEVVAGDTKVVQRGAADGLYITTAGIGDLRDDISLGPDLVRPGDVFLVSGTIADHGMAVMAARAGMRLDPPIESDCASLAELVHGLLDCVGAAARCLRDPTRGGIAAVLNEVARDSRVAIRVDEPAIPMSPTVRSACELLGLDPTHVASEGRVVVAVAPGAADEALAAMRAHRLGREAAIIGEAIEASSGAVRLRTGFGRDRILDMPSGELLPRIC